MKAPENIEQWSDSRKTSIEVALAIFEIASSEEEADRIWEEPDDEEQMAVWKAVTEDGMLDPSEYWWGVASLAAIKAKSE